MELLKPQDVETPLVWIVVLQVSHLSAYINVSCEVLARVYENKLWLRANRFRLACPLQSLRPLETVG
jgi:hypothetical protein